MRDIKLFYWLGEPNFGDMLNFNLCTKLFGINPIETPPKDCEATFIGSLLDSFLYKHVSLFTSQFKENRKKPPVKIWGTGFIADKNTLVKRRYKLPEIYYRKAEVYAVRGEYSKNRLTKILNKDLSNIPLGDPGLLAPLILNSPPPKEI